MPAVYVRNSDFGTASYQKGLFVLVNMSSHSLANSNTGGRQKTRSTCPPAAAGYRKGFVHGSRGFFYFATLIRKKLIRSIKKASEIAYSEAFLRYLIGFPLQLSQDSSFFADFFLFIGQSRQPHPQPFPFRALFIVKNSDTPIMIAITAMRI